MSTKVFVDIIAASQAISERTKIDPSEIAAIIHKFVVDKKPSKLEMKAAFAQTRLEKAEAEPNFNSKEAQYYTYLRKKAQKKVKQKEKEWNTSTFNRNQTAELMVRFIMSQTDPNEPEDIDNVGNKL